MEKAYRKRRSVPRALLSPAELERVRARDRAHKARLYALNPEPHKAASQARYWSDPERYREEQRARYQANPQHYAATKRALNAKAKARLSAERVLDSR